MRDHKRLHSRRYKLIWQWRKQNVRVNFNAETDLICIIFMMQTSPSFSLLLLLLFSITSIWIIFRRKTSTICSISIKIQEDDQKILFRHILANAVKNIVEVRHSSAIKKRSLTLFKFKIHLHEYEHKLYSTSILNSITVVERRIYVQTKARKIKRIV